MPEPLIGKYDRVFCDFLTLFFFPHDEGTLPPDIGKLVALKDLWLYNTKLSGESAQLTLDYLIIWFIMPVPAD